MHFAAVLRFLISLSKIRLNSCEMNESISKYCHCMYVPSEIKVVDTCSPNGLFVTPISNRASYVHMYIGLYLSIYRPFVRAASEGV